MPDCDNCNDASCVRLYRWMLCETCYEAVTRITGLRATEYEVSGAMRVLKQQAHGS
jgi:hypothetical protein